MLAVLCMTALWQHRLQKGRRTALTLLICMGYALLDETHQLFVAGRAFEYTDLGLDLSGTLTGVVLVLMVRQWLIRQGFGDRDSDV